jgi:hypothetical protein
MASSINASTSGAGGVITTADATGILQLQTASTTAVTVDASQNVGIGTTSPAAKLTVASEAKLISATQSILSFGNGVSTTYAKLEYDDTTGNFNLNNPRAFPLRFLTDNTERMRITSDGKIFMGSSSAQRGSERLSISASAVDGIVIVTDSAGLIIKKTSYGNSFLCLFENNGGSQVGAITTNGTNTTYTTTSDYRLKENIAPMMGALDTVAALKPVTYKWKATGEDGQGFIAHELQAVIPDCVVGEKDAVNEDGSIKPQGIDTSFLVATLTAAIQEQQTIINDLKARIEVLEAK